MNETASTYNVLYATDENYWPPLYVSLYSLLYNNKDKKFKIYILSRNKNQKFFEYSNELNNIHSDHMIEFIEVANPDFSNAPQPKWFGEGIYYRLLIESLLPISKENILYLDCDTIITDEIEHEATVKRDLFQLEITD